MKLDDLRLHADVLSADGHKLGTLSRFVFDRESLKLTHIVIDTGILRSGEALWKGGWGLSHDRVVPLGVVKDIGPDAVRITMPGDDFLRMSRDYIQEQFEEMPDDHPGWPDASDARRFAASIPGEPGSYMMRELKALAPSEEDIARDADVWRMNPHEKIGEVEHVLFDDASKKIQAIVIRRGFLLKKDVVLPASDIVEVVAGVVRVQLDDAALRALAEYKPK